MAQEQTSKTSNPKEQEQAPVESKPSETAEQVKKDTDALMDKIDDLLKEFDAEEFVDKYKQLGGE
jgi:ubiquitin-like protein Pup